MLLSGAYDETCKTWDVDSGKLCSSYDTEGLVQCVAWDFVGQYKPMFLCLYVCVEKYVF